MRRDVAPRLFFYYEVIILAYIYCIWSSDDLNGGYVGLDRGNYTLYSHSRIAHHIKSIATNPDSAGKFIVGKGISNVFYGV